MSAEKKRRVGQPRHSTLLDKLAQHPDPRVQLFIGKFVAYQRPPADAPRLRAALKRLESGLTNLAQDKPSTSAMVEQELTGLRLTIDAAASLESSDDDLLPTDAWLKQFKIYGALLLVVDDDIAALRALAAEYLRSVHTGACSHANVANNIRLRSHSPGPEGEYGSSRSWEGRYAITVQLLEDLHVDESEVSAARFQEAACSSFIWKAKRPRRYERPGLVHHRTLTLAALSEALETLGVAIVAEQPLEAGIAAGFLSGLPWELSQEVLTLPLSDVVHSHSVTRLS